MSEICNYCEVDFDYHDHSHLACECLPKQIQLLEANLARCREERDAFIAANKRCCDGIISMTAEIQAYKQALENVREIARDILQSVNGASKFGEQLPNPEIQMFGNKLLAVYQALTPIPDGKETR